MENLALEAVQVYPTLSLSIAYISGPSVTTLHHSGHLMPLPDDRSIYELGSITKTFTGALLAAAVQSKAVALSTPVKELIPALESTEFPEGITLLSLATHTSGLPCALPANLSNNATLGQPFAHICEEDLISYLSTYTKKPPPSGCFAFQYSNLGAGLLGYALEQALGSSFEELLEHTVTGAAALGMPDTVSFLNEEQSARRVPAYMLKRDVDNLAPKSKLKAMGLKELENSYEVPPWLWEGVPIRACGCLKSTLADMVTYAHTCLQASANMEQGLGTEPGIQRLLATALQRRRVRTLAFSLCTEEKVKQLLKKGRQHYGYMHYLVKGVWQTLLGVFFGFTSKLNVALSLWWPAASAKIELHKYVGPGVGLHWLSEDLQNPVKGSAATTGPVRMYWHNGRTHCSNSALLLHPGGQQGIVLLSNYMMDVATGFDTASIVQPVVRAWAGQGDAGQSKHDNRSKAD